MVSINRSIQLTLLAGCAMGLLMATGAETLAQGYRYTVIARTGDPRPDGGNFTYFTPPIFDGETVGFETRDNTAVFKSTGGAPILVAKSSDPAWGIPGAFGPMRGMDQYSALRPARGGVPFYSFGLTEEGIFSDIDQHNVLASELMHSPDGGFLWFNNAPLGYASDNRSVLVDSYTTFGGPRGSYIVTGGDVHLVADPTRVIPALGVAITAIRGAGDIRNEYAVTTVVATYQNEQRYFLCRYRISNHGVTYPVGNPELAIPLGSQFVQIGDFPTLDESGRMIFSASGYNPQTQQNSDGIFRWNENGVIEIIARNGTQIPGTNFTFQTGAFYGNGPLVSAGGNLAAFMYDLGGGAGTFGIFASDGVTLRRVAGPGTVVDGRQIRSAEATRSMVAHGKFALRVTYGDGSEAIVIAERSCPADFNGDDVLDFFDYLDFVGAFSALEVNADFNGDGIIDFFDYLDFVAAFSAGC